MKTLGIQYTHSQAAHEAFLLFKDGMEEHF